MLYEGEATTPPMVEDVPEPAQQAMICFVRIPKPRVASCLRMCFFSGGGEGGKEPRFRSHGMSLSPKPVFFLCPWMF